MIDFNNPNIINGLLFLRAKGYISLKGEEFDAWSIATDSEESDRSLAVLAGC